MPTPIPCPQPCPKLFFEQLILFLLPYFLPAAPDPAVARAEILETLASYGGRTRSEILNAAHIIAFSFAALDTLAEAKDPDLSPSLRLRYRGCANNLNRSCQQNEKTLARRMAADAVEPTEEPVKDLPDAEFHEAIQHAEANIAAYRNCPGGNRSPGSPSLTLRVSQGDKNNRLWGSAMMSILTEIGMPVQRASPA
jgi:hypothetical protein